MSENIDNLQIGIVAESHKAEKAIDSLCDKLSDLKDNLLDLTEFKDLSKLTKNFQKNLKNDLLPKDLNLEVDTKDAEKIIDKFRQKFANVGIDIEFKGTTTELTKEAQRLQKRLDNLFSREDKAISLGNINTKSFESLEYEISKTLNLLDRVNEKLDETKRKSDIKIHFFDENTSSNVADNLPKMGTVKASDLNYNPDAMRAVFGELASDITNYEDAVSKFGEGASQALNNLANTAEKTSEKVKKANNSLDGTKTSAVKATAPIEKVSKTASKSSFNLKNLGTNALKALKNVLKFDGANSLFNIFSEKIKKSSQNMLSLSNATKLAKRNFMIFLRYGLSIESVFMLVRKIKDMWGAGSTNLAKYSKEYASNITALSNAFASLQNAIACAVAPLVNAFTPAIVDLMEKVTNAINKINMFIAALMGKQVVTQSSLRRTNSILRGTTEEAEDAIQAMKQLQGFDKLNNLSAGTASNNASSGSSGGSGSGSSGSDLTFEDVPIESKVAEFANKVKEAFRNADWSFFESLGSTVSNKIKNSLNGINWNNVYSVASGFASGLASFLNGLFNEDTFSALGGTVAGLINTALKFLNTFGKTFDFSKFGSSIGAGLNKFMKKIKWKDALEASKNWGKKIATALNSFIKKTDFELLGKTVAKFVKTKVEGWYSFVTTFDFTQLGTKIKQSINAFVSEMNEVDDSGLNGWQKLGKTIGGLANGIVDAIEEALKGLNLVDIIKGVLQIGSSMDLDIDTLAFIFGAIAWKLGSQILTKQLMNDKFNGKFSSLAFSAVASLAITLTAGSISWNLISDVPLETNMSRGNMLRSVGAVLVSSLGTGITAAVLGAGATAAIEVGVTTAIVMSAGILGFQIGNEVAGTHFTASDFYEALKTFYFDDGVDVSWSGFWEYLIGEMTGPGENAISSTHTSSSGNTHGGGGGTIDVQGNITSYNDCTSQEYKDANPISNVTGGVTKFTTDAIDDEYKNTHPIDNISGNVKTYNDVVDEEFRQNHPLGSIIGNLLKYNDNISSSYKNNNPLSNLKGNILTYNDSVTSNYKNQHPLGSIVGKIMSYTDNVSGSYKNNNPLSNIRGKIMTYSDNMSTTYKNQHPLGNIVAKLMHATDHISNNDKNLTGFRVRVDNITFSQAARNAAASFASSFGASTRRNADGGAYYNGMWHNIRQYASGTPTLGLPTPGSLFIAGEAGAEIVANSSRGTEVLNESQIAQSIAIGVNNANAQQNAMIGQQTRVLSQILSYMPEIMEKCGISDKDIFDSVRRSDRNYQNINGHTAFGY